MTALHYDPRASIAPRPAEAEAIAASWRRCVEQYGMDPERDAAIRIVTRRELREALDPLDHLVTIAQKELSDLHGLVADSGFAVILTDAAGIALTSQADDGERGFQKWGLIPGAVWSEACEGTNGVGLSLTEQRAITVHRQEHFKARYRAMTCTAVPIFDAFGEIAGALDVSSCSLDVDRRVAAFARAAANQAARNIENAVFRYAYRKEWIVSLGRSEAGEMLCAFDDSRRLVGANRTTRMALGLDGGLIDKGIEVHETEFHDFPLLSAGSLIVDGDRAILQIARSTPFSPPTERPPVRTRQDRGRTAELEIVAGGDATLVEGARRILATASLDLPILLVGETGTGKRGFAEAVHRSLLGADRPFVNVACGALSEATIDGWLFGSDGRTEAGIVTQASGGTLFLDEIGDLPLHLQSLFLDLIELRQVPPRGSRSAIDVPMRIICSTQADLAAKVADGTFRADLYHRISGVVLRLPPLRERSDLRGLVSTLLLSVDPMARLADNAMTALQLYRWPGNLRELERTLKVVAALCRGREIGRIDIEAALPSSSRPVEDDSEFRAVLGSTERQLIVDQLALNGFDVAKTAQALGLSRATMYRRMRRFGL